jgi:hypothetical protein
VMDKWRIIDSGKMELIEKIKKDWYCAYCNDHTPNCDIVTKCA